jgi:trans-aconitate methyltransferase
VGKTWARRPGQSGNNTELIAGRWIPDHLTLLPRIAGFVAPGGVLGLQMPGSVLRSALSRLSPGDADRFLAEYAGRQRAARPARLIGGRPVEMLRQRRVFAVGRRQP